MTQFECFKQFLSYIEANYQEEEQLIIEDFMSYYINKYNGYGRYNCENTYKENLKNDITGELHRLSLIGFEFEKKIAEERNFKKSKKSRK